MKIILANSAGFCFGVENAIKKVYGNLDTKKLVTYGPIIHNKNVINDLKSKGVNAIDDLNLVTNETVVIRSHGVAPSIYEAMEQNGINYLDATCPYVKKIHHKVRDRYNMGYNIIIIGDELHPEIIGINGYAKNKGIIVQSVETVKKINLDINKKYAVVVQTTLQKSVFEDIINIIKERFKDKVENVEIFNTICNATTTRQLEAEKLSKDVDIMLVIGDKKSSNTSKLYSICKSNCKKTYLIESISEIELNIFSTNDRIGITAGASTPPAIIKEAVYTMTELDKENNQTFEEMLNSSFITLHTGDVVKGSVIQVINGEISVNLGYKSDGVISRGEFSDDPNIDPSTLYKPGDEIEVYVLRVNDGDGNVFLSKKRIEAQKGILEIEEAFKSKEIVTGKVIDTVKGGLIALIKGTRVFVPSSQISSRFVDDLSKFKGQELDFRIIEFDREKRRMVAGRKDLAIIEENKKKEKIFATLEVGQKVEGVVSRVVDFGVFIDLGGIDGLIHISELSWSRVKKTSSLFSVGDKVTAVVLNIDKEKGKVSLSIKNLEGNPWDNIEQKYEIGQIVEGKVVRMVQFGAFIELENGVDGLVHISQISPKHVLKPDDELKVGQIIKVKIIDIDKESKKISLSKKDAEGTQVEEELTVD